LGAVGDCGQHLATTELVVVGRDYNGAVSSGVEADARFDAEAVQDAFSAPSRAGSKPTLASTPGGV
jgi:hypothetical protein